MGEGGNRLKQITFERKHEALSFCEYLLDSSQDIKLHWQQHKKWGLTINIEQASSIKELHSVLIQGFIHVFQIHKESAWLHEIIRDCYYYNDVDEVETIVDLCHTLLRDELEEEMVPQHKLSHGQHQTILETIFVEALKEEESVHFDSIIVFRMHTFYNDLIDFVGYALDEYKREEEYQSYVEHLREYMHLKPSNMDHLLIVQGPNFHFYDENGNLFGQEELKRLTNGEPLYLFGLEKEEMNITPIIALAPEKITLYGDDPSDPKTITILNVFQEKVEFLPLKKFPFKRLSSQ